jgi:hypothetical protein
MYRSRVLGLLTLMACGGSVAPQEEGTGRPLATEDTGGRLPAEGTAAPLPAEGTGGPLASAAPPRPAPPSSTPPVAPPPATPVADLVAPHPFDHVSPACDSVYGGNLGVVDGRIYWTAVCLRRVPAPNSIVVATVATAGGETKILVASEDTNLFVDNHAIIQTSQGISVVGGPDGLIPLSQSAATRCDALTSHSGTVYCVTTRYDGGGGPANDEQKVLAWTIGSETGPSTLATGLGRDVTSIAADGTRVYLGHLGTTWYPGKYGSMRITGDGSVTYFPISGGPTTTLYTNQTPQRLFLHGSVVAWWNDRINGAPGALVESSPPRAIVGEENGAAPVVCTSTPSLTSAAPWNVAFEVQDMPTIWRATEAPAPDEIVSGMKLRYFSRPEIEALTVDATHVYWLTRAGVFRHAK